MNESKKVFISYSWTTSRHEKWVLELAERLVSDGIDVILDKWDLNPGEDKYCFMEKMVMDNQIDKVLIICDSGYKKKADSRDGGVGTETQIITPELYTKVNQRKYIPIIAEQGEKFDSFIPNYAKGLIGIDLSNIANFEKNYEELIRDIYDKHKYKKPKIGKIPSFLLEHENRISNKIVFKNKEIKNHIENNRKDLVILALEEFQNIMMKELDKFIINYDNLKSPFYEEAFKFIKEMKVIRDEYLKNITVLINYFSEDELYYKIIDDLENLYQYKEYKGNGTTYNGYCLCHFNFFIHELFIWVNTLLLNYRKYKVVGRITHTKYIFNSKFYNKDNDNGFEKFYYSGEELQRKSSEENLKRISVQADLMVERAVLNDKNYREEFIDTDIILHYISKLSNKCSLWHWFPQMYIYKNKNYIKLLSRINNNDMFNQIKDIFDVKDINQFKELVEERFDNVDNYRYMNSFDSVEDIRKYINLDNL